MEIINILGLIGTALFIIIPTSFLLRGTPEPDDE